MSSIDNRIVNLKLENGDLQSGAKASLDILGRLKEALKFDGAGKGLSDVQGAVNKTDFSPMSASIDKINAGFLAMATIAVTALSNIVNKAVDAGTALANNLFVEPKMEGLKEYELKLGSIQTIMASTGEDLPTVNKYLDELNKYSDKTIYSFADMTENIGKFTNAGVGLEDSVAALQGVANVAAISGANSNEASRAMYNFSQALSIGHVGLMDWKSIELANMGTAEFRQQLIDSAEAMGTLKKQSDGTWKTLEGTTVTVENFRNTLSDQWLSSGVLTETLGRYADGSQGIGKEAEAAATQVKTLSHLLDTLKESQASGWAGTWEAIIGDFDEARDLFTDLNETIGGFFGRQADARNKMLDDWNELGGRTEVIEGFKNIFKAFGDILGPIGKAFRSIFPPTTGQQLFNLSVGFRKLTESLKMAAPLGQIIGNVFKVIFAVLKVGVDIVKGVASVFITLFSSLFKAIGGGNSSVLTFFAKLSDGMGAAAVAFSKGDYIINFFERVNAVIAAVIPPIVRSIGSLVTAAKLFMQGDREGARNYLEAALIRLSGVVNKVLEALGPAGETLRNFLGKISSGAKSLKTFLDGLDISALKPISALLGFISDGFGKLQEKLGQGLNLGKKGAGAVGNELQILRDRISRFGSWLTAAKDNIISAWQSVKTFLAPIFKWVSDKFSEFTSIISKALSGGDLQDAASLLNTGIFAVLGYVVYQFVQTLRTIVEDFKEIGNNIKESLEGLTSALKTMQTSVRANIILKIAAAVAILAASMWLLSRIPADDMWRSLAGIGLLLGGVVGTLAVLAKLDFTSSLAGTAGAAAMLLVLSGSIILLAYAAKKMSELDWQELAKGLIGVAGLLVALAIFTKLAAAMKGGAGASLMLLTLAASIGLLGFVVEKFGKMDRKVLEQGLITIGLIFAALSLLVNSMHRLKGAVAGATAMVIISVAMLGLYGIIRLYNTLDFGTFAKGLGMVAVAVGLLGLSMNLFPVRGAIAGAGALVILGAAMWIISGVLDKFAEYDGGDIAASLGMLAGSLVLLAGAMIIFSMPNMMMGALALGVVVLGLWALSGVLAVFATFDIGDIAAALGMLAGVFVVIGLAGLIMGPIVPIILGLGVAIGLLGLAMLAAGAGMALFGLGFATLAATGVAGIAVLVAAFEGIIALIPIFMEQVGLGLIAFARVISESGPEIVAALTTILMSLLAAIETSIPEMQRVGTEMILSFLDSMEILFPEVIDTGFLLINMFLTEVEDNVPDITNSAVDIIVLFIGTLEERMDDIVSAAADLVVTFIEEIDSEGERIMDSATTMILNFTERIKDDIPLITYAGFAMVLHLIAEIKKQIDIFMPDITEAAIDLGLAIPAGIIEGIRRKFADNVVANSIVGGAKAAIATAMWKLGIRSPSRLTRDLIGIPLAEGIAVGITKGAHYAENAAVNLSLGTVDAAQQAISTAMAGLSADMDMTPTITPVIDLTQARRDVGVLSGMMPTLHFGAEVSANRARVLYDARNDTQDDGPEDRVVYNEHKEVKYEQNLYSPKALSTEEIYRQTSNQLSQIKKEL